MNAQNWIIGVVALAVVGGGAYFYSASQHTAGDDAMMHKNDSADSMMSEGTTSDSMMHESTSTNEMMENDSTTMHATSSGTMMAH